MESEEVKPMKCCKSGKSPVHLILKIVIIGIIVLIISRFIYHNTSLYYLKKIETPFSLHLNKRDLYLEKGEEFRLFVYGINKRVSFSTTNFRVAGVNFNGRVFAYQTGKAFIIAKVDRKQLKCRVHVVDLNKNSIKLSVGNTYDLDVKGANALVSWKSSNPEVASVNAFGKVRAKKKGMTTIKAKIRGKILICKVRIV